MTPIRSEPRIIQIIPLNKPLVAVFGERDAKTKEDLMIEPCLCLALLEHIAPFGGKGQPDSIYESVQGMTVNSDGITHPSETGNFLGYATDEDDAAVQFLNA